MIVLLIYIAIIAYAIGIISLLKLDTPIKRASYIGWTSILAFSCLIGAAHLKFNLLRFSLKLDLIALIYIAGMILTLTIIGHTIYTLGKRND